MTTNSTTLPIPVTDTVETVPITSTPSSTTDDLYTIQYICNKNFEPHGSGLNENNDLSAICFPFENEETWKIITDAFATAEQPSMSETKENASKDIIQASSSEMPSELKYLSNLFSKIGKHSGSKFCNWLKVYRVQNQNGMYETFFNDTLPFMKRMILEMKEIFPNLKPLRFLPPNCNSTAQFTRGEIACILCCCFFGVYAHCDFGNELGICGVPGKYECWVRYFDIAQKHFNNMNTNDNSSDIICSAERSKNWFFFDTVTVYRRSLKMDECQQLLNEQLMNNTQVLNEFNVNGNGCIEDIEYGLNADFANEFIGGGVLSGGNVQEEIRFTVDPECIISKFLCPLPMKTNEAIIILGSIQYFNYKGYGSSFKFDGYRHGMFGVECNISKSNENMNNDDVQLLLYCDSKSNHTRSVIVGIDALYLWKPKLQITAYFMARELIKCYVGYSLENEMIGHCLSVISTGNWGCGIFRGDPQLKAMLQWIVATLVNRRIEYFTFKDKRVMDSLKGITQLMVKHQITVGQLWNALINAETEYKIQGSRIFQYLCKALKLD